MPSRPMTASQLRRANYFAIAIGVLGGTFFLWDFYLSFTKDVPRMGVLGYLVSAVCAHKVSEVLVAAVWIWTACMYNHEKAGLWPTWMPPQRYRRALQVTAVLALVAVVLATYAWTVLNLGTSARTTNIADPPGIGEEWMVWRFYLGAVVLAAAAHVVFALRKVAASCSGIYFRGRRPVGRRAR